MAISIVNQWNTTTGPNDIEQSISPTPGNWLIAIVAWKSLTTAVQPVVNLADTSRNLWFLLSAKTVQANNTYLSSTGPLNVQIWACPAVAYVGWSSLRVFTAIQSFTALDIGSVDIKLLEVAGMGNGFLTVDSIVTGTANNANGITLTLQAPAGGADCLMVAAASGDIAYGSYTTTGVGWTQLSNVTNTNPECGLFSAWREATTSGSVTFNLAAGFNRNWSGVAVAIRATGTPPPQQNPNWPATEMQLGLGYDLSTPLSAVWWTTLPQAVPSVSTKRGLQYELGVAQAEPTDITLRNKDGGLTPKTAVSATASAAGTTTTFLCLDAQAASIAVGDYFRLKSSSGALKEFTVFQVTGLSSVSGTTTVTFTAADGSGPAQAATATNDVYQGTPVDIYTPYRLLMSWGGKRHCVTAGWAERWPQTWDNSGYIGQVTMTGTGTLANLTAANPTCLAGEIMRRKPYAYWPLSDGQGATAAQNVSGRSTATLVITNSNKGSSGTNNFGASTQGVQDTAVTPVATSSIIGDPGNGWNQTGISLTDFNAGKGAALVVNDSGFPPIANGVTIFFVHYFAKADQTNFNTATAKPTVVLLENTNSSAGATGAVIKFGVEPNNSNTNNWMYPIVTSWDRSTHAATAVNCTSGEQWEVPDAFVSGALVFNKTSWRAFAADGFLTGSGTCNLADSFSILNVCGEADQYNNGNCCPGILAHVAVFDRMLTDDEIGALDSAMKGHQTDEITTDRVQRKLDTIGMKASRLLGTDGQRTCSAEGTDGSTIADINNTIGGYEDAILFEDAAGNYQYRPPELYSTQTAVATLGERADLGEIPYQTGVTAEYDSTYIYNSVTITNTINTTQSWHQSIATTNFVAIDSTSTSKYGIRSLSRETRLKNNSDVTHLASRLLSRYKTTQPRLSEISIDPASNPSAWQFCLTVEVGDKVTVKRRPLNGQVITFTCTVLQVAHTGAPGAWKTTLTLTPALS